MYRIKPHVTHGGLPLDIGEMNEPLNFLQLTQTGVITPKPVIHDGAKRIALYFDYQENLITDLRAITQCRWSRRLGAWHVPDTDENRLRFNIGSPRLSEATLDKTIQFKRWLCSKRYCDSTIKTYTEALNTFLIFFYTKPIAAITHDDVIAFNNDYIMKNHLSASYQNQVVNAIKLFFKTVELRKMNIDLIHRPKKEKTLPNVLSKQEVKEILEASSNIKHKAMLSLIYSCGLRRSELLNLKLQDIDSKRNLVIIRQAKGRKDRIVPLSQKMLFLLRSYYKAYLPKVWLFEGQDKNMPYDERSLASVLKRALEKTTINKPVTLHWLRHSYATHVLEAGTDLRYIQELLGHKHSKTTEIYTHVSTKSIQNIKSPFDDLDI